jgi:serine/threonine protein kinase
VPTGARRPITRESDHERRELEIRHRPFIHRLLARTHDADDAEVVKALDFGIAKVAALASTATTAPLGSPSWMAPEQSDPSAAITPATDVWAVGLLTFYLMTGKPFWAAANDARASIHALVCEILVGDIPPASVRAAELGARRPRRRSWPWALAAGGGIAAALGFALFEGASAGSLANARVDVAPIGRAETARPSMPAPAVSAAPEPSASATRPRQVLRRAVRSTRTRRARRSTACSTKRSGAARPSPGRAP